MARPNPANASEVINNVLTMDIGAAAKAMEDKFPTTWQRMNTKSIQSPPAYYGYKAVPISFASAIEECRMATKLETNLGIIAGIQEKYDFPTYYVSGPLLEALKHSHPPEGLTWADLKLPFPGMMFMVPRGSLIEPEPYKGEIICIGVTRFPRNTQLTIPTIDYSVGWGSSVKIDEDRISVHWVLAPSALVTNDCTFPESHPLEPLADWIDTKSEFGASEGRPYYGPKGEFSSYIAGLVANFILVMEARKELIEPGALIHRNPREGRPNVYSPTFIGRNYAVIRKDQPKGERKAQFTVLGWRAGHFKRQHFGPKTDQQTKTIFVDPYIAFTRGLQPLEAAK